MSDTKTITAIEVQAKRKDRYSVFLDDEFAFGIHQDVLLKSGIAKGDRLTEKQIAEILDLEERKAAKDKAMRLLAVRARSKKELEDRLARKYPAQTIDWVLKELERLGLIDDAQFAIMFARSRMVTRPEGAMLLRRELLQKGVAEKDIEKAIEEAYREKSEREIAREVAQKRKRSLSYVEETKAKKRLADFMLRRGFQWDVVKDIIENWETL